MDALLTKEGVRQESFQGLKRLCKRLQHKFMSDKCYLEEVKLLFVIGSHMFNNRAKARFFVREAHQFGVVLVDAYGLPIYFDWYDSSGRIKRNLLDCWEQLEISQTGKI